MATFVEYIILYVSVNTNTSTVVWGWMEIDKCMK